MDLEKSHYLMTQANKADQENDPALRERLGANLDQYRIMCYTDKAPVTQEGIATQLRVAYSSSKNAPSGKKSTRVIPTQPEKILDAPELVNDWYINVLSWGSPNILAVALSSSVYLWNATTGDIKSLLAVPEDEYISSLSWIQDGTQLAVGNSLNVVEIWDAETGSRLRKMTGHSQRISSLDWNAHLLSSGSKSGLIFHHDVRVPEHHVGTLNGHEGNEICGLKWSPDGKYLASGSNDWFGHNFFELAITLNSRDDDNLVQHQIPKACTHESIVASTLERSKADSFSSLDLAFIDWECVEQLIAPISLSIENSKVSISCYFTSDSTYCI